MNEEAMIATGGVGVEDEVGLEVKQVLFKPVFKAGCGRAAPFSFGCFAIGEEEIGPSVKRFKGHKSKKQ